MKNFFIKHVTLLLLVFTIPIQTKNSISNISNKVRSFFKANTEDVIHQECKNVSQLEISCDHGDVTIDSWQQPCVFIELKKKGNDLFLKNAALKMVNDHNNLQVSTTLKETKRSELGSGSLSLRVLVPKDLPIKVTTTDKTITINNASGPLELYSTGGAIFVHQGDNTVIAKTVHSNIVVQRKSIKPNHALNLSSQHGNITLAVPQDINAELEAHSLHGKIYSDLFVTMNPQTILLSEETFKNMRRHIEATIGQQLQNNDPATILLSTDFGTIKICGHDCLPKKK